MTEQALEVEDDIQETQEIDEVQEVDEEVAVESSEESAEDRARKMGWKPQEEYEGKNDWVDAEEFLNRAENDPAQLKKTLRTLERNYSKLEKGMETVIAHQQREVEQASKKAYEQAIKDVEARLSQAVEDGDKEAVVKAIKSRDALMEQQSKPAPKENAPDPVIADWKAKNTWFDNDPVLAQAAADYTNILAQRGMSVEEQLKGAEEYVRETFPHKFRQPKEAARMPNTSNNRRKDPPKAGSYEALTPEAKAECDRFVKSVAGKSDEAEARANWLQFATEDFFRS